MNNQIFEPVEVIGYFCGMNFNIIKFKWRESIFNVTDINATWKVRSGNSYTYHYSVSCMKQNKICELTYDITSFKWEIIQITEI